MKLSQMAERARSTYNAAPFHAAFSTLSCPAFVTQPGIRLSSPRTDQHRSSPEYSSLPRLLQECYQPQVAPIRPRFQLELNILRQGLSLLQSTNPCKTLATDTCVSPCPEFSPADTCDSARFSATAMYTSASRDTKEESRVPVCR